MKNSVLSISFKQKGITLIELMVAVLIVILIATVAMVSLKNSRAKARDAKRVYDLSQYAKAFQLYAQENDGTFPETGGFLGASRGGDINDKLKKYLVNLPADPKDDGGTSYKDYYYYYVVENDCKNDGILVPTIHIQNIETSNSDYQRNPCDGEGSNERYANIASFLLIIR